jgi:hypothetical protein
MTMSAETAVRWFRRVLWIGIVGNLSLAIPTFVAPARMMAVAGLPIASPLLWPRFAGLLMILLSVFYMPAGVDPVRYRATAWTAVASRLAGVCFFLLPGQPAAYHLFGWFDFAFLVPEALLLPIGIGVRGPVAAGARRAW